MRTGPGPTEVGGTGLSGPSLRGQASDVQPSDESPRASVFEYQAGQTLEMPRARCLDGVAPGVGVPLGEDGGQQRAPGAQWHLPLVPPAPVVEVVANVETPGFTR